MRSIKQIALANCRSLVRTQLVPSYSCLVQEALKEPKSLQMGVGVSYQRSCPCYADHKYVRVRRTKIVLYEECAAGACRRCAQAGVIEFQRSRSLDAPHKRGQQAPIRFGDPVGLGAFYLLRRYLPLEPIDLLMEIHN